MRGSFRGGFKGRNKRRDVLFLGFRGMSFESESSLESGVVCSVGGTSGNGLFLVREPSGFSTKSRRSVSLTEQVDMDWTGK